MTNEEWGGGREKVREYLEQSPCAEQSEAHIATFMDGMAAYKLEKGELLQIVNERPETVAELDCIVEEMDPRFTEDQIEAMLQVVRRSLPPRPVDLRQHENEQEHDQDGSA